MTTSDKPFPKLGTLAFRVLVCLAIQHRPLSLTEIGNMISPPNSANDASISARIRELRTRYGFDIAVTLRKDGKNRTYLYTLSSAGRSRYGSVYPIAA